MSNRTQGKIISAAILIFLFAVLSYMHAVKGNQIGREAYLAQEASRFDRHYAHHPTLGHDILPSVVVIGGFLAVYELLSFGATKMLDKIPVEHRDDQPPAVSN